MLAELDPMLIPCQPEPPWIKRCSYGIKFTDEIQIIDEVDFGNEHVNSKKKKKKKQKEDDPSKSGHNPNGDDDPDADPLVSNLKEQLYNRTSLEKASPYCKAHSTGNVAFKSLN